MDATITELLATNRKRRFRRQQGQVVQRADGLYLRYYTDDASGLRTRVSVRLCDLGTDTRKIKVLRDQKIAAVNADTHEQLQSKHPAPPLSIGGFWIGTYLPWARSNLRYSSWRGYERLWSQYLEGELSQRVLSEYRTVDGSKFLTNLAHRLGRNSLAHVRSLASGIFTHALNLGMIESNPWHDVKVLARVRAPRPKVAYTVKETVAILNAIERADAKLFFALCAVLGTRPEEAAAVKWENVDLKKKVLKIREAAPYGVLGELKTEQSKRDLVIIEPVHALLAAWWEQSGKPQSGLLFTRLKGLPVNHNAFARRWIAPFARKACARWCGCYSGRHGAATTTYDLTGDLRAVYQNLGNSLAVVSKHYVKPDVEAGREGSKLYEKELKKARRRGW